MRLVFPILLTGLVSGLLQAQEAHYSPFSVMADVGVWGIHQGYSIRQSGSNLHRGPAGFYENSGYLGLRFNYRLHDAWAINGMVQVTERDICLYDKKYLSDNSIRKSDAKDSSYGSKQGIEGYAGAYKYYYTFGLSIDRFFNIYNSRFPERNWSWYVSAGALFNTISNKDVYFYEYRGGRNDQQMYSHFTPRFNSCLIDFGFNSLHKGQNFYIGLRYTFSDKNLAWADYTRKFDNKPVYTEHLTVSSSFIGVVVSYGLQFRRAELYELKSLQRSKQEEISESEAAIDTQGRAGPRHLNRNVHYSDSLSVQDDSVTIYVWDKGTVDGDVVSLYLNGEILIQNLQLTAEKTILRLKLNRGQNELILYVEDEGRIKPCTVAVLVVAGEQRKLLSLVSSYNSSAGILFNLK